MAELRKCGRCRSVIELTYFGINRKGKHNNTCITCLDKRTRKQELLKLCVAIVDVNLIKVSYQYINEYIIVKFITWKLNQLSKTG